LTDVRLGPQPTKEPTLAGAVLRRSAAAVTRSRTGRCAKWPPCHRRSPSRKTAEG